MARAEPLARHPQGVVIDIDVVRACCGSQPTRGAYAYSVLLGADYYSGFLGGGGRTWLNPYLGFRLGATDIDRRGDFAGGLVLGLEIFKTERTSLDLQARALGLVGNADGPHAAVLPRLDRAPHSKLLRIITRTCPPQAGQRPESGRGAGRGCGL